MIRNDPCPNFQGTYSIAGNSGEFFNINPPEGDDWKILITPVHILSKECEIVRGGYVGLARNMEAYKWLHSEENKTHIIGDYLLGLFVGLIVLWFYWAIKQIFKK